MRRLYVIAPCALGLVLFTAGPLSAQEEPGTGESPKAEVGPEKAPSRPAGRALGRGGVWWNDPNIVSALALTQQQREAMDGHLKAYREDAPKETQRTAFSDALQEGDRKAAHAALSTIAEQASVAVRSRGGLKIDVLSVLSDEQRKKLVDGYPRLIFQPWQRAMSRRGTR